MTAVARARLVSAAAAVALVAAAIGGCSGSSGSLGVVVFFDGDSGGDAGDTPANATNLGVLPVLAFREVSGRIDPIFDEDWFAIFVDVAPGEALVIRLDPPFPEDYDLEVLDETFLPLGASAQPGSVDEIVLIGGYSGRIYVGVSSFVGDSDPFDVYYLSFDHRP